MNPQSKRMQNARARLILRSPFFGALALRLELTEAPNTNRITTNGKHLSYDPATIAPYSDEELQGILAHETGHCALAHHARMGERNRAWYNIAADKTLNRILRDSGYTLPSDATPPDPNMDAYEVERIYREIYPGDQPDPAGTPNTQQPPGESPAPGGDGAGDGDTPNDEQNPDQDGDGDDQQQDPDAPPGDNSSPGGGTPPPQQAPPEAPPWGDVEPADESETPAAQQAEEWKQAAISAANVAKQRGNLPGSIARLVDELARPRIDWKEALRQFLERTARNDYSWTRPNRAYLQRGIILPTLHNHELPPIAIAVDTSGSIGQRELDAFAGEINSIREEHGGAPITVLYADAEIAAIDQFDADDPITLSPRGGGGTDFRPVFNWIEDRDEPPRALLYFTDGYGSFPDEEPPDTETLWLTTSLDPLEYPMGEAIRLDLDE